MKTYIQPETKVVKIHVAQMMAVSTLGVSNTSTNNIVGDSRQDNSWDIWGGNDEYED